jgi:hypothetical protein
MPAAILRLEKQGMLSRALSLATVTLLIGCLTAGVARAVENLDAGKSPSQIFSNTCSACHKSPRGLLKNTPASSLPGFLRQHYTTGTDMASVLSTYLISNGAADPRYQGKDQPKKDAKQDGKPDQPDRLGRRQPPAGPAQEASRPDADAAPPQGEGARPGRDAKRFGRRHAAPDATKPADAQATEGQAPVQAATDSKSGARQKQGRRGKPIIEESPKTEQAAPGDAAKEDDASRDAAKAETAATDPGKTDPGKTDPVKIDPAKTDPAKADSAKTDTIRSDGDKPATESENPAREVRSNAAKVDTPRENVGGEPNPLRPDPAPPVAPAPPASAATAAEPDSSAAAPPPVTAPAAVAPAGPPVPPISR